MTGYEPEQVCPLQFEELELKWFIAKARKVHREHLYLQVYHRDLDKDVLQLAQSKSNES